MNSPLATVVALIATIWLAAAAYLWLANPARMQAGRWTLIVLGALVVVALLAALWRGAAFASDKR